VRDVALALRTLVLTVVPDAREEIDRPAKLVGYSLGPGYAGMVCVIIPSQKGVKLGLVRGAELADPLGLLQGDGKRHRHVAFASLADLRRQGIKPLLRTAVAACKARLK
jgi:hypothetical protein